MAGISDSPGCMLERAAGCRLQTGCRAGESGRGNQPADSPHGGEKHGRGAVAGHGGKARGMGRRCHAGSGNGRNSHGDRDGTGNAAERRRAMRRHGRARPPARQVPAAGSVAGGGVRHRHARSVCILRVVAWVRRHAPARQVVDNMPRQPGTGAVGAGHDRCASWRTGYGPLCHRPAPKSSRRLRSLCI